MIDFPDLTTLQKTDDGTEYIYGGSVGINRILGHLRNSASSPDKIPYTLYLINIYTLVRNAVGSLKKDASPQEVAALIETDTSLLDLYIKAYSQRVFPQITPIVVYYAPTYNIPEKFRKKPSPSQLHLEAIYQQLLSKVPFTDTELYSTDDASIWSVRVGSGSYPHKELSVKIGNMNPRLNTGKRYHVSGSPVCLITHCPLDLHLARRTSNVYLLESFTGSVKTLHQFGSKLADTEYNLPFNTVTHRLFGDSIHLKPLVDSKSRKLLLQASIEKQWKYRPESAIAEDASRIAGISMQDIFFLKL